MISAPLVSTLPVAAVDAEFDRGFDVLSYRFDLEVTDLNNVMIGEAYIEVVAERAVEEIELDLIAPAVEDAANPNSPGMLVSVVAMAASKPGASADRREQAGERYTELEFEQLGDSLTIRLPVPMAVGQEGIFRVTYSGIPGDGLIIGKNRFGARTFFSDNYPNRARHYLPTVDHPSDKALCGFSITAPIGYQVIACGEKTEETDLPGDRRLTVWQNQVPIPTKVMTVGIARFAVESLGAVDGIPIETWVYPQDREKGFLDFAPTPEILRFFHRNIGPYPYRKLASVQSTTRYGGMENAGNIFYGEGVVSGLADKEELIAHELAHQWFGDSVSEQVWQHVWLSEGFATYGAALYLEHRYGPERLRQVMSKARLAISRFAERQPEARVLQSAAVPFSEMLNPNVYQKGAFTLHMLRKQIGDEAFWDSLRSYYARYRDRNANTRDFQSIVEEITGQRLDWFFEQWLERAGHPSVQGKFLPAAENNSAVVELQQEAATESPFDLLLDLGLLDEAGNQFGLVTVRLSDWRQSFPLEGPVHGVVLDPASWALIEGAGEVLRPPGMTGQN